MIESGLYKEPELAARETDGTAFMRRIHPNVKLGKNVVIDDFCVIGYPPKGCQSGELETIIGDNTVIRSHAVIYAGVKIGSNCHIGHAAFIREHTTIGNDSSVGTNTVLEHHITIGERVRIQGQAGAAEYSVIEDDAWIGPRVILTNVYHPGCEKAKECLNGPIIRKGAILAANVVVCPDLDVGERAFVGAGSVITHAVPAEAIMFGVPAKKIGVTTKMQCRYDMMDGRSPYPLEKKAPTVPLVDLVTPHQNKKEEIRLAMDRVILNQRYINGKEVQEFETAFAAFCGAPHCIGVSNGTSALQLALQGFDIGPGDEVITSPHTFFATAEAILALGAKPVFVDIDEETFNLDPALISAKITARTRAIVPVLLYGNPAGLDAIATLAKEHGLRVIADAAQAHGAQVQALDIAQWVDAASYSFFPAKNLGGYGDSGGVVTRNPEAAEKIARLKDHGREKKHTHFLVGGNHRMDTLQAAILLVKLKSLGKGNEARKAVADRYRAAFKDLPLRCPSETADTRHVYHLFVIRSAARDKLAEHLRGRGVATGLHYPIPLHLQPALKDLGHLAGDFPVCEKVVAEILSLPIFPELTDQQFTQVADGVKSFHGG